MSAAHLDPLEVVVRKLERLERLDPVARKAIAGISFRVTKSRRADYLVRDGDSPTECCVLLDGYACRHKIARDGARQIVSFHLPGDILDLQHMKLPRADHNVQTITDATIGWVKSATFSELAERHPTLNNAFWRDALVDASIFREWVLNVGRRDAITRVAHMLCEFAARRQAAGLGGPERIILPMTQEDIADATGLTPVHVNRMLRSLRERGVVFGAARELIIDDWPGLQRIAGFDVSYLHEAA